MARLGVLTQPVHQPDPAPRPTAAHGSWEAVIASEPTADGVMVKIPGYSPHHLFGPCPFIAHPPGVGEPITDDTVISADSIISDEGLVGRTHPLPGDRALVTFSDNRLPWVVAWHPTSP
jgi:hypothetical protein